MSTEGRTIKLVKVDGCDKRVPVLAIRKRGRFTVTPVLDSEVEAWVPGRGPHYVQIGAFAKETTQYLMFHVTLPHGVEIEKRDGPRSPGRPPRVRY